MPKASVVILSHRAHLLPEALASALAQTETDLQIVVQYSPTNWGTKLNEAVAASCGEYLVVLCDDDLLAPTYLTDCLRIAELGADIVYTDRYVFQHGQAPTEGYHFRMHGEAFGGDDCYWIQQKAEDFRFGSSLPMTCLIRRKWWNRMAGYDPEMPHADTEFWYRSILNGARTAYVPKPLFWYREHPAQFSKTNDAMEPALKAFHTKHFQQFGFIPESAVLAPDRQVTIHAVPPEHRLAFAAAHSLAS